MTKKENEFQKVANRVSMVSIIGNLILSLLKLFAGIFAHSAAMISDAIHSASDVFSTIVVIIGVHLSSKESDKEHPYGHERLECEAAIILAMVLFITGLGIGIDAAKNILQGNYAGLQVPGIAALIAAIVSIVSSPICCIRCISTPIYCVLQYAIFAASSSDQILFLFIVR